MVSPTPSDNSSNASLDLSAIQRPQRDADGFDGHRIDVSAEGWNPSLCASPIGRARAHEWIENRQAGKGMTLIETLGKIRVLIQGASQQYAAKNCAQPFRPPFVDVVNRPVNFLPPTLAFCQAARETRKRNRRFR